MKLVTALSMLVGLSLIAGCASRPVNPPITQTDLRTGYRLETRQAQSTNSKENLVILAFSGGGTRAAAFSYGVRKTVRDRRDAEPVSLRLKWNHKTRGDCS